MREKSCGKFCGLFVFQNIIMVFLQHHPCSQQVLTGECFTLWQALPGTVLGPAETRVQNKQKSCPHGAYLLLRETDKRQFKYVDILKHIYIYMYIKWKGENKAGKGFREYICQEWGYSFLKCQCHVFLMSELTDLSSNTIITLGQHGFSKLQWPHL